MAADIDQPGKFEAHLRSRRRGRDGQHIDVDDRHDDGLRGHGQARGPDRHAARRAQVDLPGRREARGDRGLLPAGRKGSSLLVKITGKTKPGKYAIALRCEDKHNQPDSVDVKRSGSIRSSALSSSRTSRPAIGIQARCDGIQRAVRGGGPQARAQGALAREASGPPRVARTLVLSRAMRGSSLQPSSAPSSSPGLARPPSPRTRGKP